MFHSRPSSTRPLSLAFLTALLISGCSQSRPEAPELPVKNIGDTVGMGDSVPKRPPVARIDGASMAPTFAGDHFLVDCSRCRNSYRMDAEQALSESCCPLCGKIDAIPQNPKRYRGDRVKIQSLETTSEIQRWDVIAFRNGQQHSIKRVLGLPGELIEFDQGDLLVGGHRTPKPEASLNAMQQLVFDSRHSRPEQWLSNKPGLTFPITCSGNWTIEHRNFANYLSTIRHARVEDIKDFHGYNQTHSRSLNRCDDLICELEIENLSEQPAGLHLVAQLETEKYGRVSFGFRQEGAELWQVIRQNGRVLIDSSSEIKGGSQAAFLSFGLLDGWARTSCQTGGETPESKRGKLNVRHSRKLSDPDFITQKIRLECTGKCGARLNRWKIHRDIHYFASRTDASFQLGADEYFVVGDNVPLSKDSRNSPLRPKKNGILGIVSPLD